MFILCSPFIFYWLGYRRFCAVEYTPFFTFAVRFCKAVKYNSILFQKEQSKNGFKCNIKEPESPVYNNFLFCIKNERGNCAISTITSTYHYLRASSFYSEKMQQMLTTLKAI